MKSSELPTIDYRKVKPLQGNLKDLTKENFEKLEKVLVKRGFDIPVFMWNGFILDGHQRVRVAQEINLKPYEVPYIEIEAENELEAKKRVLEISSQYGTITQEGYDEFTADLPEAELVETVNFDALSWSTEEEVEEDEPPEFSKEPAKSKLGEVYQLGRHRLMCGDTTESGSNKALMGNTLADMVFTDPPYGVDYEGKTKDKLKIENDTETEVFDKAIGRWMVKPGASFYVCCPQGNNFIKFEEAFQSRCHHSATVIWVKNSMVLGHGDYHYKHEPILYGWDKEGKHEFYGDRTQTTVWEVDRPTVSKEHPTMKPIALVTKAIQNSSKPGDVVLDPFGGSGTTLLACEQTDRTCYMMELDPKYVDVIRKRYHKLVTDSEEDWEEGTPVVKD